MNYLIFGNDRVIDSSTLTSVPEKVARATCYYTGNMSVI